MLDAVTGSWSGVEMWIYQCHIRASGGRETVMSVCLDLMISPGVCCTPSRYSFWHNKIETVLSVKSISRRIGVSDEDDDSRRHRSVMMKMMIAGE